MSATLVALVLTAGCARSHLAGRVPLSEDARAQVRSPRTIVVMSDRLIGVSTIPCSTDMAIGFSIAGALAGCLVGGFIGGAVGDAAGGTMGGVTGVASGCLSGGQIGGNIVEGLAMRPCRNASAKAEAELWPVRDALLGYDLGAILGAALERDLGTIAWLKGNLVEVWPLPSVPTFREMVRPALDRGADTVLLVKAHHVLSPAADALLIKVEVRLFSTGAGGPFPYYNELYTSERLPEGSTTSWADRGRALAALTGGLADIARMIAFDLQQDDVPRDRRLEAPAGTKLVELEWRVIETERGQAADWSTSTLPPVFGSKTQRTRGYIAHEGNGRQWVRLPSSGALFSVGAPYPENP